MPSDIDNAEFQSFTDRFFDALPAAFVHISEKLFVRFRHIVYDASLRHIFPE